MPITPDLLTIAETARELGLTPATVRNAIARGALQAVHIDARTNAVARQEVERYRRENLRRRGPKAKDTAQQPADAPAPPEE